MSAIDYSVDGKPYEGWFVPAPKKSGAPVIVIAHAWGGLGDNEKQKAKLIATDFGYNAFAIDVYGKGKRGTSVDENQALMNPLLGNRGDLQSRLKGGLAAATTMHGVDASRVAAIGFCFGGLCVLDMARAGHDVLGVASFHGLFAPADNLPKPKIKAKILLEHGWLDPMAKPEDVIAIGKELNGAGADWQLHAHGRAVHSFTTAGANNRSGGTEFDAYADRRSFAMLKDFLAEIF